MRRLWRAFSIVESWYGAWPPAGRWLPALAWFTFVSVLSHVPGTDVDSTRGYLELFALGDLNALARMGAHSAVFGTLAVLVYLALGGDLEFRLGTFALAAALTAGFGMLDELHQHFVPLRHGRLADALVDALGGALLLGVVLWTRERARRLSNEPAL